MDWPSAAALLCPDGLWADQWTAGGHGKTVSPVTDFLTSASKGCLACTMLLRVVEEIAPGWTTRDSSDAYFIRLEHSYASSVRVSLVEELPSSSAAAKATQSVENADLLFTRDCEAGREGPGINVLGSYLHQLGNGANTTFALLCTQTGRSAHGIK